MSAFTTPLKVQYVDGEFWIVLSPFSYYVGEKEDCEVIFVHAGFQTDFASIPRWAWPIIGHPAGDHGKAAVIHDYLYVYPHAGNLHTTPPWDRTRRRCDQIFLEALQVLGVGWWKRSTMYFAVRVGGSGAWKKWREAE